MCMFARGVLKVWPFDLINFFVLHPRGQTKAKNKERGGTTLVFNAHPIVLESHRGRRYQKASRQRRLLRWASVVNMQMIGLIGLKRSHGSNSVISHCQINSMNIRGCLWVAELQLQPGNISAKPRKPHLLYNAVSTTSVTPQYKQNVGICKKLKS